MGSLKLSKLTDDEAKAIIESRRIRRMEHIDSLPPELRACIHDYGFAVVDALMMLNVKKARQIRHVVETVLDEFSPTRGSRSAQGARRDIERSLP